MEPEDVRRRAPWHPVQAEQGPTPSHSLPLRFEQRFTANDTQDTNDVIRNHRNFAYNQTSKWQNEKTSHTVETFVQSIRVIKAK
jgi:hypothetical protein